MTDHKRDQDQFYYKGTANSPKQDANSREEIKEMAIDMEFILSESNKEETS